METPLLFLVAAALLALMPALIAHSKGHSFGLFLLYGMVLWPIALIHSLCLSDQRDLDEDMAGDGRRQNRALTSLRRRRRIAEQRRTQEDDERQAVEEAARWRTCPDCAEQVRTEARVCRFCGLRFPESLTATQEVQPIRAWRNQGT